MTVADVVSARSEIDPEDVYNVEADIFSPCATGGVLNEKTISRLRVRAVAGAANNPLASHEDARRLQDRGILYVPDYVANAGATIRGALGMLGREAEAEEKMSALRSNVRKLIEKARSTNRMPLDVAGEIAEERIRTWNG